MIEQTDRLRRNLARLNLVLSACLLGAGIALAVRLIALVGHLDKNVVAMSDDLAQVSSTAAQISRDVTNIWAEVVELKDKVDAVIPREKVAESWRRADAATRDALTEASDWVGRVAGTNATLRSVADRLKALRDGMRDAQPPPESDTATRER